MMISNIYVKRLKQLEDQGQTLTKAPDFYGSARYGLTLRKRSNRLIFKSAMRLARETTDFLRVNLDQTAIEDKKFLQLFNSKEYQDFLQ